MENYNVNLDEKTLVKEKKENAFKNIIKAVLIALVFSVVSILLFALVLKFLDISDIGISTVNQVIKILSILIGCLIVSKHANINAWKGSIIGLFYSFIAFILFSALSNSFIFDTKLIVDLIFATIIGLICGVIVRSKK